MRTAKLLDALAKAGNGITCTVKSDGVIVTSNYKPRMLGSGDTLFQAASQLAGKMSHHLDCPLEVKEALDDYYSRCLSL